MAFPMAAVNSLESGELWSSPDEMSRPAEHFDTLESRRRGAESNKDKTGTFPVPVATAAEEANTQPLQLVDTELVATPAETPAQEKADTPQTQAEKAAQWEQFVASVKWVVKWADLLDMITESGEVGTIGHADHPNAAATSTANAAAVQTRVQTVAGLQAALTPSSTYLAKESHSGAEASVNAGATSKATSPVQQDRRKEALTTGDTAGACKSPVKKVDPIDGNAYTLPQLMNKYKNQYSIKVIKDYFHKKCSAEAILGSQEATLGYILAGIEEFRENGEKWVGSRILGPKGANMKRIIAMVAPFGGNCKLRLRGRGSGYKEKDLGNKESTDDLMLCISCDNQESYQHASAEALELVKSIQAEYCAKKNIPCSHLTAEVISGKREGGR